MAVDINQVLSFTSVIAPLIIGFIKEQQQAGQPEPTLEEINERIAQRGPEVVAEIERMQRAHPRTTDEAKG